MPAKSKRKKRAYRRKSAAGRWLAQTGVAIETI
jgi:hypothetical protein